MRYVLAWFILVAYLQCINETIVQQFIMRHNVRLQTLIFGRPLGPGLCHRKSVRLSVCPSVTLVYCGQTA